MMPARGRDMHISAHTGEGGYIKLAGLRTKAVSLRAAVIDSTHLASPDGWRECAPGSGVKSAEVSGRGIFHRA